MANLFSTTRRHVLKLAVGIAATLGTGVLSAMVQGKLIKKSIPSSGEKIPAIGLGTARTFDVDSNSDQLQALALVMREFALRGGTLVDSSPMYGNAETIIGILTEQLNLKSQLFYATKVWTSGRQEGIDLMNQSQKRMQIDQIDLMQIHNLIDWKTHIKTLYQWKEQKRIRYIGITHYVNDAFADLENIMKTEKLDFVQLPYSIGNREAEKRLLPLAQDKGIATLINVPFERGRLFKKTRNKKLPAWVTDFDCQSWAQFFLKYILSHDAVTCPIPATSKPKHMIDNMQAVYGRLPDQKMRDKMVNYFNEL